MRRLRRRWTRWPEVARSAADLTPGQALIWRVVHRDNLPWILDHGVHCANGGVTDPNYVQIGKPDLIRERNHRMVPVAPGGTLADYVSFYFTPFSPMTLNIVTGRGVTQRDRAELCLLVTSLHRVAAERLSFVFSDRHASLSKARFSSDLADLTWIDWPRLQSRDFQRDPDDPERFERYEAEALVHAHLPLSALQGVVCYDSVVRDSIADQIHRRSLSVKAVLRPEWYFP